MTGAKERSVKYSQETQTTYGRILEIDYGTWNLTFGSNLEQSGGGVRFREKEKREKRLT